MTDERTAAQPAAQINEAGQAQQLTSQPETASSTPVPAAPSPMPWTDAVTDFTAPEKLRDLSRRLEALVHQQDEALSVMMDWAREVSDEKIDGEGTREQFGADLEQARLCRGAYAALKKESERG